MEADVAAAAAAAAEDAEMAANDQHALDYVAIARDTARAAEAEAAAAKTRRDGCVSRAEAASEAARAHVEIAHEAAMRGGELSSDPAWRLAVATEAEAECARAEFDLIEANAAAAVASDELHRRESSVNAANASAFAAAEEETTRGNSLRDAAIAAKREFEDAEKAATRAENDAVLMSGGDVAALRAERAESTARHVAESRHALLDAKRHAERRRTRAEEATRAARKTRA